jgi:Ca2+-binding RTX toxin-like protein
MFRHIAGFLRKFRNLPCFCTRRFRGRQPVYGFLRGNAGVISARRGEAATMATIDGTIADDYLAGTDVADTLNGLDGNDELVGGLGNDTLNGAADNDDLDGGDGNDQLNGGTGNDTLEGGVGTDTLVGGTGDDLYVDPTGDTITELVNEGTDTVQTSLTFTIASLANVENITLTGQSAINATGNAGNNVLTGNSAANILTGAVGNDTLIGGLGNDTLVGGTGNDTYVNPTGDTITELTGEGTDTVESDVTFTLSGIQFVENLTLTGSASINGTGNSHANVITGNGNDNIIIGGAGNDTLIGGNGNDTVSFATEIVNVTVNLATLTGQNTVGAGTDTISGFENLTGGSGNDTLTGDASANIIQGGAGNDTMVGGGGLDTASYAAAVANVTVSLALTTAQVTGGAGTDTLSGFANLLGGSGNDALTGNTSDNVLEGGLGNDTLSGGTGNDTASYASSTLGVSASLAVTTAQNTLGAGTDTFISIENLLGGSGNDSLTGTSVVNVLTGGAGDDTITGGGGADSLVGGAGNDLYINASGATVTEAVDSGIDTIESNVTLTLASIANVENLTLTGATAINGTGNTLANLITGNSAANALSGGDGNDTLVAGTGNDTLTGGNGNDLMSADGLADTINGGADTDELVITVTDNAAVFNFSTFSTASGIANTLRTGVSVTDVETLYIYAGSGNDRMTLGTGGGQLDGNGGNDTLTGAAAIDVLNGGLGNDSISAGAEADILDGGDGNDTISGGVDSDNIVGGIGNDVVNGDDGADFLNGGGDADTMAGGLGFDTFFSDGLDSIDGGGDDDILQIVVTDPGVVFNFSTFNSTAGVSNTLRTGVTVVNVEFLSITAGEGNDRMALGAGGGELYGFVGNDTLTGGTANDLLDGGDGNDSIDGGLGDDGISAGIGNDTVTGGDGVDQIFGGNDLDSIGGGLGTDSLFGENGDDVLNGDAGNDTLSGGADNDTVNGGADNDTVNGDAGNDVLNGDAGLDTLDGGEGNDVLNGGTENDSLLGGMGNDALNGGAGTDTLTGGDGNDTYDEITGDTIVEAANGGIDTVTSAITISIASIANVENLTLTGSAAINGTGNALDNFMLGNSGANTLTGSNGNDTFNGGLGADTLIGGLGNDVYVNPTGDTITELTGEGTDRIDSDTTATLSGRLFVEDLTLTGSADINGTGNSYNNFILGNGGANVLNGGAGNDTLSGAGGTDTASYASETVNVTVSLAIAGAQNTVGAGTDTLIDIENLTGGAGNDALTGNASDNFIEGGAGNDTMTGGGGNDTVSYAASLVNVSVSLTVATAQNTVGAGTDTISGFRNLIGGAGNDALTGDVNANILTGGLGNDTLNGGSGADTASYAGATGNVSVSLAIAAAQVTGGAGTDTLMQIENLIGGLGNDTLTGDVNANLLEGGAGNDTLSGGGGADTLIGGLGNDRYVHSAGVTIIEAVDGGTDEITSAESIVLPANVDNVTLTGTADANVTGNTLANFITGNSGANILVGGGGADTLAGGLGNDTYSDAPGITIIEAIGGGIDTVTSSATATLAGYANVENLLLTGASSVSGTGNDGNNLITGNFGSNALNGAAGNDTLDGGPGGSDTLSGGTGNDTYINPGLDIIVELSGEGTDTIETTATYTIASLDHVERITLTGSAAVNATGNGAANLLSGNGAANLLTGAEGNDTLVGADGHDTLIGGTGTDSLQGGLGNDLYIDVAGDTVVEGVGEGIDTIQSSTSQSISPLANVENIVLTGSADITATGNAQGNVITGNTGNNILDGGTGADTLTGGLGNDSYRVDNAADVIVEAASAGTDTVLASVSYTLATGQSVEVLGTTNAAGTTVLDLTGNELGQRLDGNAGSNILDGRGGADQMYGLGGNDSYRVDHASDQVFEAAAGGTDTVLTTLSYTLAAGQSVETLGTTDQAGTTVINLTGNELAQRLNGNAANNVLDGKAGADQMYGYAGNDTYYVDNVGDVVGESSGNGTDTVLTTVSYALTTNQSFEALGVVNAAGVESINLTGNNLDQRLNGNAGNNVLDGGGGVDQMFGLAGDDTYYVDNVGDAVDEAATAGNDTVLTSISYTLGSGEYIEIFRTTSSAGTAALNLTGNAIAQRIDGNAGDNVLDGAGGNDTLYGGAGNDTYRVDAAGDQVFETVSQGTDTVLTSVTYVLAAAQSIEVLGTTNAAGVGSINLTGNEFSQRLDGNAGANILNGLGGDDQMYGGLGSDTYNVDSALDTVNELVGEGTDVVFTTVTYALAAGQSIETVTITDAAGVTAINLTGNELAQRLNGNAGANILDGGGGADTMYGYGGDDIFYVDDAGDQAFEANGLGTDTVISTVSFTLQAGSYIELLRTISPAGTDAIDLTGNSLAQRIEGNAGANALNGLGGADTLYGGAGKDSINVGSDINVDVVVFNAVSESTGASRDTIIGVGLTAEDKFDFHVLPTSVQANVLIGTLSEASFDADLAAAIGATQLLAGGALIFDPNAGDLNVAGQTFLIVDANGVAGYQAGEDYVVQLSSSSGTLSLDDFI